MSRGPGQSNAKTFIAQNFPSLVHYNPTVDISYQRLGPQYYGGKPILSLTLSNVLFINFLVNDSIEKFFCDPEWTSDNIRHKLISEIIRIRDDPGLQMVIESGYEAAVRAGVDIYKHHFPPPKHLSIRSKEQLSSIDQAKIDL